ncbi:DNA adenine methylase [Cohaesibacter celericrescens]|uniref:DNA adenine methylase n=1 Tax=Cohaesibacter celericrescens TaxID=2067669 RepID=UPI001AECB86B|nr:DNA adenine methylase [Cohaesibacter celericrescens]
MASNGRLTVCNLPIEQPSTLSLSPAHEFCRQGWQPTYGVASRGARFDLTKIIPLLEDVHERLSGVTIECLSYADCIKRYDRPETLFYLDPPCWNCEDYYGKGVFSSEDFQKLADQLAGIKGRFLFSINDVPEIREICKGFEIEEVTLNYTASSKGQTKAKELVIGN